MGQSWNPSYSNALAGREISTGAEKTFSFMLSLPGGFAFIHVTRTNSNRDVIRNPMKSLQFLMLPLVLGTSLSATAASLMLDFGATAVASPYLSLSPGHALGGLDGSETNWNAITTS